jgi:hypothetical protein
MNPTASPIQVSEIRNPPRHRPPCAYVVDDYYRPEYRELRERFKLDEKIAGAKDRFDALLRLSNWLGGLNEFGAPPERVATNALEVLETIINKQYCYDCGMMPHVLAQCAHALGYNTRINFMGWNGEVIKGGAHHGGTEVWVDGLDKWVYVDALHRIHYERRGVPLSLCEVRQAAFENQLEGVHVVIGPEREMIPMSPDLSPRAAEETVRLWREGKIPGPRPCSGMYFWIGTVMTNATFANLQHNTESYFRVLVFRDQHNGSKVWFQRYHPTDESVRFIHWVYWGAEKLDVWSPHQWHFPLNQVHIDWEQKQPDALELMFETTCPNFAHFEIALDGQAPVRHKQPWFTWRLHPGANTLRVSTENLFGVKGTASELRATA